MVQRGLSFMMDELKRGREAKVWWDEIEDNMIEMLFCSICICFEKDYPSNFKDIFDKCLETKGRVQFVFNENDGMIIKHFKDDDGYKSILATNFFIFFKDLYKNLNINLLEPLIEM